MKYIVYTVAAFLAGCFTGFFTNCSGHGEAGGVITVRRDTVTVIRTDTTLLRDTVRVEVPHYVADTAGMGLVRLCDGGDSVSVRRERRVYSDSTFRAVVSGVMPQLDSLTLFRVTPSVTRSVTRDVVRDVYRDDVTAVPRRLPRWSLGVTAGLTATSRGFSPGITVGVSYRIF